MAASIGVNFAGIGSIYATLGISETAGVVAQDHWNNVASGSGTNVAVNDNTGAASGALLTFTAAGADVNSNWGVPPNPPANSDEKICNGCLYSLCSSTQYPSGTPVTVTISDIPAAYQASGYDVYIYMTANRPETYCDAQITAGSTNWYAACYSYYNPANYGHLTYTQVTSTDSANPTQYGDYVRVTGQSASSFSFSVQTDPNAPFVTTPEVFGFQIVAAPEPATMVLLALGGILTLSRRRR
jgi:hypothetical protein